MQVYLLPEEVFEDKPKGNKITQQATIAEKVEFPKEGGMLTYIKGYPYPVKWISDPRVIHSLNFVKRMVIFPLQIAKLKPFRYFLPLLLFLPKNSLIKILQLWGGYAYQALNGCYLKPERFCKSTKVLYDILMGMTEEQGLQNAIKTVCMIDEFDTAYRYRRQDLFGEIDIYRLRLNPRKEVLRLLDIWIAREVDGDWQKNKIKAVRAVVSVLLLKGYVKKFISEFAWELKPKLTETYLDEGDKWYCANWSNYEFSGIEVKKRILEWRKI